MVQIGRIFATKAQTLASSNVLCSSNSHKAHGVPIGRIFATKMSSEVAQNSCGQVKSNVL